MLADQLCRNDFFAFQQNPRTGERLVGDAQKVASDLQQPDKTYADLAAAEKRAVSSGDGAQIGKSVHDIEIAASVSPKHDRFQILLNGANTVWSDLVVRDKTYAWLVTAEEQAAASGDAAPVQRSLESLQRAARDFPRHNRFQLLLNKAIEVETELERRNALVAQAVKSVENIEKVASATTTSKPGLLDICVIIWSLAMLVVLTAKLFP